MSDATLVERNDGLVTVTFNRPDRKNALNADNWNALDRVLTEITFNPRDRALLITGAGGNFSSGADLGGGGEPGLSGLTGREQQAPLHEMRWIGELLNRLHRLPKPTIAAVDGVAVGVGLGVALACDLVIASDRARFSEIFVKRGLALDGGTSFTLPHLVGIRRAKQLAFFGDMLDAQQALDWGLVNEVVAPDQLLPLAQQWGQRLATGPTTALSLIKRMLDESASNTFEQAVEGEARAQQIIVGTNDLAEGMTAFIERRDPNFTGT
jgi:2-(1,2-epoxy-1,2-dihydrophenyl)acetyl-CoA isomerase